MSKSILITRDENQARELASLCESRGFTPVGCPLIKIVELEFAPSVEVEKDLQKVLIFTSRNSVRIDVLNSYPKADIVAVGDQTAESIRALGFEVDLISSRKEEVSLGAEVCSEYDPTKYEIVLFQGNTASRYLEEFFSEAGYSITKHLIYEVQGGDFNRELFIEFITNATESANDCYVTLLSRYTAEQLISEVSSLMGEDVLKLVYERARFFVIGEKTADYLKARGAKNVSISPEKSIGGLIRLVEMSGGL